MQNVNVQIPYMDEIAALFALARSRKGQGSLEYIMMLSAVSIVIVIALAMVTQLKGTAVHAFMGSSNQSIASQLSAQLGNLTTGVK
ncbi:MAG TPA: class III signal peptide-containing protein [Candidatus Baltobacteraceae bacterium]|nr:class III signal peptide-containing protein [Candidatus Baltobacteraceae bacterium]